jgi:hypothetical protein
MSTPPESSPQPARPDPLAMQIPRNWTQEEALAVYELIDDLRDKIWTIYDCRLQALLRERRWAGHGGDDNSNVLDEGSI